MPEYQWPKLQDRRVIGRRTSRIDGLEKASGAAKYTFDINRPGMLHAKMLISPHAHARIKKIDTSAAEALPGVKGILLIHGEGNEVLWHGEEIAMVAAETEERARDAVRAIEVDYEVLPHVVNDQDLEGAGDAADPQDEQVTGEPDATFQADDVVVVEGDYGIAVITHCCLESHGVVAEWTGSEALTLYLSTQNVSGTAGQLADGLSRAGVPTVASNVRVICQHVGGGFGSKFSPDRWGLAAARLAKETGRPVKAMLERDHELLTAGNRPSGFGKIKVAAKRDGSVVGWQSEHWGTAGSGRPSTIRGSVVPYLFTKIPNKRTRAIGIRTNRGTQRAWRAPHHPQGAALTMAAFADAAAALHMDELEFFKKNVELTALPDVYAEELDVAAELIGWKKKWHPRGDKTPGPTKRGLGISMHTWGGRPHPSTCDVTINPDGSVLVQLGSQDLGTGTRTVLAMVAAETFGLKPGDITVQIGDSQFKTSRASGGSTTVGGVGSSCRRGCVDALAQLFEKIAPALGAKPEELEAAGGRVRVKSKPPYWSLSWRQACAKLGMSPVTATGSQPAPGRPADELASQGVGGVQIADVSVDIETGVVKINDYAAVQDQGLVINPKTCESQVLGAVIMGICYALYEEQIMDPVTGRTLNPDMEFYKLAGIGDIGNIKVHLMSGPKYDAKGIIGNGEPPVISPGAAITNAVANAIGVRVPYLPLTPERVLAALEKGGVA